MKTVLKSGVYLGSVDGEENCWYEKEFLGTGFRGFTIVRMVCCFLVCDEYKIVFYLQ